MKRAARLEGESQVMDFLRRRIDDERRTFQEKHSHRISETIVKERVFLEDLEGTLRRVFSGGIAVPAGYAKRKVDSSKKKRIVNLALSDLHFQSQLDPREVPLPFGSVEEARRLAKIVQETVDYKPQYRDDSELFVHLFGDIISGEIHEQQGAAPLTQQFCAAVYLLIQALTILAAGYKRVTVRCVPGNHGRRKGKHVERAVNQKWDSYENMIYFALKMAAATLSNVRVEIPFTAYYTYTAFENRGFVTHGDTVLMTGFPSQTIDVKKIRSQINEWNAGPDPCDLFLVGHAHTNAAIELPSGPSLLVNGCLMPPDPYMISRGSKNIKCGQQLWESVPGHIVGDRRFLNVDESTDKDSSLDKLIRPYSGFADESPLKKTNG